MYGIKWKIPPSPAGKGHIGRCNPGEKIRKGGKYEQGENVEKGGEKRRKNRGKGTPNLVSKAAKIKQIGCKRNKFWRVAGGEKSHLCRGGKGGEIWFSHLYIDPTDKAISKLQTKTKKTHVFYHLIPRTIVQNILHFT
jgi:hypothetical protein